MSSISPVLLILGGGANVGNSVARAFAAKGYKVASTSRTLKEQGEDGIDLHVQGDLSNPLVVPSIFEKVRNALGTPSVVVYNAAAATQSPKSDPLSLSLEDLKRDLNVNTVSALAAARESVAGFKTLTPAASPVFIYTGNVLNSAPMPALLSLGIGKSGTAHLMSAASEAYASEGYRFYYADERNADGSPAFMKISGPAHGEFYTQLAESKDTVPWLATFVKGKGYTNFIK